MWPFRTPSKPLLTPRAAALSRPMRNPGVEMARSPSGRLLVTVRRPGEGLPRILSYFVALPRKRTFELDERGERFWDLCDGKRTIKRIEEAVRREWRMPPDEARAAVHVYAGNLMKRGLLTVEAPAARNGRRQGGRK